MLILWLHWIPYSSYYFASRAEFYTFRDRILRMDDCFHCMNKLTIRCSLHAPSVETSLYIIFVSFCFCCNSFWFLQHWSQKKWQNREECLVLKAKPLRWQQTLCIIVVSSAIVLICSVLYVTLLFNKLVQEKILFLYLCGQDCPMSLSHIFLQFNSRPCLQVDFIEQELQHSEQSIVLVNFRLHHYKPSLSCSMLTENSRMFS